MTVNNVLPVDAGPTFDGTAGTGAALVFTQTSLLDDLAPTQTATFTATYALTAADAALLTSAASPSDAVANTGDATGTPTSGTLTTVTDTAETGIIPNPVLTLEKTLASERRLFPTIYEVTFVITASNDGNIDLSNIQLVDDLTVFATPAIVLSATITSVTGFTTASASASYTGVGANELLAGNPTLAPTEVGTVTIVVTYSTVTGFPSTGLNTVTGSSDQLPVVPPASVNVPNVDADGDGAPDSTESPTSDRDGDGIPDAQDFDPTGYFYCEEDGRILNGGQITVTGNGFTQTGVGTTGSIIVVSDGTSGFYQFNVTAPGTYTLSFTDPTTGVASTSRLVTTIPTPLASLVDVITGTTTTDPRILGSSEFGATGNLSDFSLGANPAFYNTFVIAAGDPNVFSNNIPFQACTTPGALTASKAVLGKTDVVIGDLVSYQLNYDLGATGGAIANATLVDLLPVGISYVPNSAAISLNGGAGVPTEPVIAGRRLSWTGQNIPTSSILTVTFNTRVAANAPVGRLTNQTFVMNAAGVQISNTATADVDRIPEHVFDCSDIIGKVFDDKNHNGYQDKGEPGLPSARVVTVKGTRITTDEHGRYHVPCAELPADIGTNFIMKLDPRSLPTGYRVTTENPRVVRLTAGKFAKLNFGASISNVVRINLNANVFETTSKPKEAFKKAIRNLLTEIKDKPSVVRLAYVLENGTTDQQARKRLIIVEKFIRSEWRRRGQFKLNIERTLKRRQ